ncbi:hypothetical protein M3P05_05520 [Sansalvadorimonas sp. 2012CJ34-2]|uniref:Uncharacterized protein n=1 Tax=Parendozoicomonas callyspongiae TaxID=2942213 RepID=A0ABT0PDE2_9GAMM|nr:hypothetical protein [Sansalvadorimonas sp. 2012CJ34-2]MCL6269404.1 hypothetical protein [Sansalvadorimonas sp. 2012CJ34-2]
MTATPAIPEENGFITIGDRKVSRLLLQEHNIHILSGRTALTTVGQGAFGTVFDFIISDKHKDFSNSGHWVFKPELSKDQGSYNEAYAHADKYPLSYEGWIHSTLRSAICYQVAKKIGIPNFVETHIGFSGNTHGMLMRKVEGMTAHEWLFQSGYFRSTAIAQNISEEKVEWMLKMKHPYQDREFINLMRQTFDNFLADHFEINKQWKLIQTVSYLCGQGDRAKLTNLMVSFDSSGKPIFLTAIDNDLSFPVTNSHIKDEAIPDTTAAAQIPLCDFTDVKRELLLSVFPNTYEPYVQRAQSIMYHWYERTGKGGELSSERKVWNDDDIVCSVVEKGDFNSGGTHSDLSEGYLAILGRAEAFSYDKKSTLCFR